MSIDHETALYIEAKNELIHLRVSVARIAQAAGVDNELHVTGAPYEVLYRKACTEERGWNNLAGQVVAWAIDD